MKRILLILSVLIITSPLLAAMKKKWLISSFPLALRISEAFTPKEVEIIKDRMDAWEKAIDYQLDFFDYDFPLVKNFDPKRINDYFPLSGKFDPMNLDQYFPLSKNFPPESLGNYSDDFIEGLSLGIYKSRKWFKGIKSKTLAATRLISVVQKENEGGAPRMYFRILHADIVLNYREYIITEEPRFGEYDFTSIIVHELGHLLGLGHNKFAIYSSSVMKSPLFQKVRRRKIVMADREALWSNYFPRRGGDGNFQISGDKQFMGTALEEVIFLTTDGECLHFLDGQWDFGHHINFKEGPTPSGDLDSLRR